MVHSTSDRRQTFWVAPLSRESPARGKRVRAKKYDQPLHTTSRSTLHIRVSLYAAQHKHLFDPLHVFSFCLFRRLVDVFFFFCGSDPRSACSQKRFLYDAQHKISFRLHVFHFSRSGGLWVVIFCGSAPRAPLSPRNVFRAYWSQTMVWSLMAEYAAENTITYDAVILARPDVWFHKDIDLPT